MLLTEAIRLVHDRRRIMSTSNQTVQTISPLRQRMLEDMRMRKLSPKTQSAYIRAVRNLARFLGRSPDTATSDDLRRYQLHLVDSGTSAITINTTITALKFFFEVTVRRADVMDTMESVRVPHKLPVVLSREEVARLIRYAGSMKYQAALSVAYGAGLRASEVAALKVGDVDSERMILRIDQGKGSKDRYAMLSPLLLDCLRAWWKEARAGARCSMAVGSSPGRIPSIRFPPVSSTVPFMRQQFPQRLIGVSRCTPCGTASLPTSWNRRWIFA
jgi:site-specific recombinase XerD